MRNGFLILKKSNQALSTPVNPDAHSILFFIRKKIQWDPGCSEIKYLASWRVMAPVGVLLWRVPTAELCLFSNRGRTELHPCGLKDFLCIFSACVCWKNLGHMDNTGQNAANRETRFCRTVKALRFLVSLSKNSGI